MKRLKWICAICLACLLCFAATACGDDDRKTTDNEHFGKESATVADGDAATKAGADGSGYSNGDELPIIWN